MDPVSSPLSGLPAVVQALLLRQGMQPADVEALFQSVGQELSVLFLGQAAEGARLEMPSGRTVTAQGELPFPEGTRLRVRVEAEAGVLKLQTLEARPPAPSALLVPLVQGEAVALAARLLQPSPAPELAPLVQLLRSLGGVAEPAPQEVLPPSTLLAQEIAALPPSLSAALARALGAPGAPPEALAARLAVLPPPAGTAEAPEAGPAGPTAGRPAEAGRNRAPAATEFLLRFQGLLQRAEVPQEHRSALDGWIRSLISRKAEGSVPGAPAPPPPARPAGAQGGVPSRVLSQAESARAEAALKAQAGPAVQVPEAWEAWVKGSVRALADPSASPREAPFHALQAKEGTGFFEIPLPWAGGRALQLWVEEDAPEGRAPEREEVRRVLLSLNLAHLGETRVGLQSTGRALAVRIWTEHPERVEALHAQLEQELGEAGKAVDLRILALKAGPDGHIPDLRSLVGGSGLHAMG